MTKPMPTAISVSSMCSTSRGCRTGPQLSRTQSVQKKRFSETQVLASPKSGITGSLTSLAAFRSRLAEPGSAKG